MCKIALRTVNSSEIVLLRKERDILTTNRRFSRAYERGVFVFVCFGWVKGGKGNEVDGGSLRGL